MLRLIGFLALLAVSFLAGMEYQKSRTAQKIVAERIHRLTEKMK